MYGLGHFLVSLKDSQGPVRKGIAFLIINSPFSTFSFLFFITFDKKHKRFPVPMQSLKIKLHQACSVQLEEKIQKLRTEIKEAQESASEDTKSSARDKFETSREMIKLEINKFNQQLNKAVEMLRYLKEINPEKQKETINFGSLVKTNEGVYFFSIALGKFILDKKNYFFLSLGSPIGQALRDRKAGEEIEFMGRMIKVEEVG